MLNMTTGLAIWCSEAITLATVLLLAWRHDRKSPVYLIWAMGFTVSAVGVIGGYIVGVKLIGVDEGAFWSQMQAGVDIWKDIANGVIKSVVFGFAVTFIALFQGYEAQPTPEGVSRATTRTVVIASLTVLWLDFLLTALMFD